MGEYNVLVPARAGSKGLRNKNLLEYKGNELWKHAVLTAHRAKYKTNVTVSTDIQSIKPVNDLFDVLVRPKELCADGSSIESVIEHFILSKNLKEHSVIVLLQPTSPLRSIQHINDCLDSFLIDKKNVVSGYLDEENKYLKNFIYENGKLEAIREGYPSMRRQDLPDVFVQNGAIYVFSVASFIESRTIVTPGTKPYIMDKMLSLDIDSKSDYEKLLKI